MVAEAVAGPLRVRTPAGRDFDLWPTAVAGWRQRGAERVAASAAAELGTPTPAIRWFTDDFGVAGFNHRSTPGVIYLFVGGHDLEHTIRHEVAHAAGILTEDEPEAFAKGDPAPMVAALRARAAAVRPIRIVKSKPIDQFRQLAATYDADLDPAIRSWIINAQPATRSFGSNHSAWVQAQIEKRYAYMIRTAQRLGISIEEAIRSIWPSARDTGAVLDYARRNGLVR